MSSPTYTTPLYPPAPDDLGAGQNTDTLIDEGAINENRGWFTVFALAWDGAGSTAGTCVVAISDGSWDAEAHAGAIDPGVCAYYNDEVDPTVGELVTAWTPQQAAFRGEYPKRILMYSPTTGVIADFEAPRLAATVETP